MDEARRKAVVNRLRSIEGHVGGLIRMAGDDAYCVDLLHQIQAVQAALSKVEGIVLDNHVRTCLITAIRSDDAADRERVLQELVDVFQASGPARRSRGAGSSRTVTGPDRQGETSMTTVRFHVPDISCDHCVKTIQRAVNEVQGVTDVRGDVQAKSVEVQFGPPASQEDIVGAMTEWGYPPEVAPATVE
jgi:copper ion binding protein